MPSAPIASAPLRLCGQPSALPPLGMGCFARFGAYPEPGSVPPRLRVVPKPGHLRLAWGPSLDLVNRRDAETQSRPRPLLLRLCASAVNLPVGACIPRWAWGPSLIFEAPLESRLRRPGRQAIAARPRPQMRKVVLSIPQVDPWPAHPAEARARNGKFPLDMGSIAPFCVGPGRPPDIGSAPWLERRISR
jgi:hypothetical protein